MCIEPPPVGFVHVRTGGTGSEQITKTSGLDRFSSISYMIDSCSEIGIFYSRAGFLHDDSRAHSAILFETSKTYSLLPQS